MGASASSHDKDENYQFLANVHIGQQRFPEELYPELVACMQTVSFGSGDIIIREGDMGDELFVIKRGKASVTQNGEFLAELESSDYFGENSLMTAEPRTATVTATTRVEALKISRTQFQKLGLHEKLVFPKREKVNRRILMLAAGHISMTRTSNEIPSNNLVGVEDHNNNLLQKEPSIPKHGPTQSYFALQCLALWEIFGDRLNMTAFVLVPLGQYCSYAKLSPGIIFASNFLAIVPLASILGQVTEALANHTGQLVGGLLNATFGNAVEMIMCIQAVRAGLIDVVQGNLLGSILSNLLLVLGMAIVASGVARKSQEFNAHGAAANMTCQLVASISVCLPTCFASVTGSTSQDVLEISRICSMFLMSVYCLFLFFMLKTHAELFADEGDEELHGDELSASLSCSLLFLCTFVVFLCSALLVASIEEVSRDYGLSKSFIGVILLPIVGNAAEHATAVTCAYKGMMDLALGVAVGSSTQIALFVVPCTVVAGYFIDQPMNLEFPVFDTACQMLTVFLVSQVLQHGSTNWLHGAMLLSVYCAIATLTLFME